MQIFDSVKKEKLEFKPIRNGEANIYLCGPTVYDDAHLGHAKSAISFDMLRRTLKALGYKVKFVRNYTDIDDKILKKMSESNKSLAEITSHYIDSYKADMNALNVLEPDISPKATECIEEMIRYIQILLQKDVAYTLEDGIYFDTSKDGEYLSLSGKSADLETIARVDINDKKRDKKDFVLWKFDENWYESPFGKGRPGWHSECVAMIKKYFNGDENYEIDIHAGGIDLLFPHHENEAAQCRCANHKDLSKYWMHNGFIQINGEKMSKSLQNSFFVKDALKHYHGEALRFYLLSSHYRANFNYSELDLEASKKRLDKLYRLKKRILGVNAGDVSQEFKAEILEALSDDLNTSKALAALDEFVKTANEKLDENPKDKIYKAQIAANIKFINEIFGIAQKDSFEYFQFGVSQSEKERINELIIQRSEAKKERNFERADIIRQELSTMGISIMDTPEGTMWERA
ncbi:cysteine--tRNA ligase [Campylobacter sp. RM9344]|uniref:Cysteine--tRNA ligase n=1 Tax=Campylobacter californiensis TaxID=1032243 RepID=A0AAW3ZV06_9BACT|nr:MULTISPECIES: cysteine--tRNA ligase [unclassified Campylobacter]MBE2984356.1 cysteine--tRNA ligase [Campylobacter sp. RM6883]MBE2994777.1 cysteine--tRNA ligase [Campylobacter sp. RM6913]MBE3030148.1 cysteine--tRNA ligase [Campylobacter sp. RM9344]MBE3608717.1 cysteine--tRNA ligase [Campylobacter sp. RM9337]QCD50711.1 cysteinyl-tRNA synthetase [Campylobacter sp. RM6914]